MSLDADLIVDRRRMRRKLTFWRVIAIGVIVLAVAGVAALGSIVQASPACGPISPASPSRA